MATSVLIAWCLGMPDIRQNSADSPSLAGDQEAEAEGEGLRKYFYYSEPRTGELKYNNDNNEHD